jgi:hypothetical protein
MKKAPVKPAPAKRKPATFGGDDSDDDQTSAFVAPKGKSKSKDSTAIVPVQEVQITELDLDTPSAPAALPSPPRKSKKSVLDAQPPPKISSRDKPPAYSEFSDLSSVVSSRKAEEATDPSIYDYDGVYDSIKAAAQRKKAAAKAEDEEAKSRPRYMASVLSAAAVRERDRLIAEEKRLAREREAEGDEYKDKEKFVTDAYRKQQEEMKRLEEEEKVKEEEERKKNKGRGMAGFFKEMLERDEQVHEEMVKAVEEAGKQKDRGEQEPIEEKTAEQTDKDLAKEILGKGGNITVNDDGEIVDKRELLKSGLNVSSKKKAEAVMQKSKLAAGQAERDSKSQGVFAGGKQAMRERQTRMLEAQLEESLKRAREEEEEEKKKIELVAKSRKTEADISSAKERYLARKRAAEEAKKNGLADAP